MGAGESIILAAIEARRARGLSLRAWGAEGYTRSMPFTFHAPTAERRDEVHAILTRRGYTVEREDG